MIREDLSGLGGDGPDAYDHPVIKPEMIDADQGDLLDAVVENQGSRFGGIVNSTGGFGLPGAVTRQRSSDRRRNVRLADTSHDLPLPAGRNETTENEQSYRNDEPNSSHMSSSIGFPLCVDRKLLLKVL